MSAATVTPDFRSADFLREHIAQTMAFYHPHAIDPAGGFFHYFKDDGTIYDRSHRHLVSSTRFVVTYALAAIEFDNAEYLDAARHGLRYLREVHRDPYTGGYAWTSATSSLRTAPTTPMASPSCCSLSHGVQGRHQRSGGLDGGNLAPAGAALLGCRCGPVSRRSRCRLAFQRLPRQNANMHMCEAMLAAYQASDEPRYLERAHSPSPIT
jgi:N-acyl-D-glucosamine 2-epimerase